MSATAPTAEALQGWYLLLHDAATNRIWLAISLTLASLAPPARPPPRHHRRFTRVVCDGGEIPFNQDALANTLTMMDSGIKKEASCEMLSRGRGGMVGAIDATSGELPSIAVLLDDVNVMAEQARKSFPHAYSCASSRLCVIVRVHYVLQ